MNERGKYNIVFARIRHNLTRKVAVLAVFGLVLGSSGLASLAQLQSTVTTTVRASLTTIDLSANGSKALVVDFGQILPGDERAVPITFTNNGTGYVKIPSASTTNGSELSLATQRKVSLNIDPATCAAAPFGIGWNLTPLEGQIWPGDIQIPAGGSMDLCLLYKIGAVGGVYSGNGLENTLTFAGYHP
jgi:hypothetical protein